MLYKESEPSMHESSLFLKYRTMSSLVSVIYSLLIL